METSNTLPFNILSFLFFTALMFFANINLQVPFVFYGLKIVGITFLLFIRFMLYPKISYKSLVLVISFLIAFTLLLSIQYQYLYYRDFIWDTGVYALITAVMGILFFDFIRIINIKIIEKSLLFLIMVFSLPIIFQFIGAYVFHLSSESMDIALLLGGDPSRSGDIGRNIDYIYTYRPTGLTSEPSMSSGVIFSLLTLYYFVRSQFNLLPKRIPIVIGVSGMLLSLSTLGLILSILFSIVVFSKNIKHLMLFLLSGFLIYPFIYVLANTRIERFISGNDGSSNVKIEMINFYFSDPLIILFGYSSPNFTAFGGDSKFEAMSDLSFVFASFGKYGLIFGTIIVVSVFLFLLKAKLNFREFVLVFLAMIKISSILSLTLMLFLSLIFRIKSEKV